MPFVYLAISILFAENAHGDYIVASNLPPVQVDTSAWEEVGLIAPNYNGYVNVSKGQTFIPHTSGVLTEVDALIGFGNPPSVAVYPPLQLSVFTSNAGIPLSQLASVELPMTDFSWYLGSDYTRETIDFSEFKIPLASGAEYMIVFATPFGVAGSHGGHSAYLIGYPQKFLGLSASQARDGITWERFGDIREIAIEVRAVPEPNHFGLVFLGIVAIRTLRGRLRVPL